MFEIQIIQLRNYLPSAQAKMSDSTDIQATLNYEKNNKIRPYFYAYQRSEEERKSSHNESDLGGETVGTEVTGT